MPYSPSNFTYITKILKEEGRKYFQKFNFHGSSPGSPYLASIDRLLNYGATSIHVFFKSLWK